MFLYCNQVDDMIPDIVSSLEGHPHIRRVTPHKKVTRTLKFVKRENFCQFFTIALILVELDYFLLYFVIVAGFSRKLQDNCLCLCCGS